MSLEVTLTGGGIGLVEEFAIMLRTVAEKGMVTIPDGYGEGYIRGFNFNPDLRMIIRNYVLKDDLILKREAVSGIDDRLILSFNDVFFTKRSPAEKRELPSVQLYSANMNSEMFLPGSTNFNSITIGITLKYLKDLLKVDFDHHVLKAITNFNHAFLFEELLSPEIQNVASEMADNKLPSQLHHFYFKVKSEELICLLFAELLKRENTSISSINANDAQIIYRIREKILAELHTPPLIADLAKLAGMSESKLKRLFKQIFGESIFNYYQSWRMKAAAELLRENKDSVSEIGYKLGFTNLSHFSRLFEQYFGMKPKKWSKSVHTR